MIDIKNLEEKKRIIVFYKCLFNQYPENMLCNSRIYDVWLRMWKDDFVVDGKCLKMWHQKFVESVAKHKHHAEPPAYYAEYNDLINSVTDFANANYNIKESQKENQQHCKEILKEYRINCEKELNSLIEKINREDLSLIHSNQNDFMKLAKYILKQNDTVLFKGNFDKMKEFILEMEENQ